MRMMVLSTIARLRRFVFANTTQSAGLPRELKSCRSRLLASPGGRKSSYTSYTNKPRAKTGTNCRSGRNPEGKRETITIAARAKGVHLGGMQNKEHPVKFETFQRKNSPTLNTRTLFLVLLFSLFASCKEIAGGEDLELPGLDEVDRCFVE